jgi:hypothetical protein
VLVWLPWIALVAVIAARWGGAVACVVVGAGAILLLFLVARMRAQRFDIAWLVRELDARRPDLEDSTDLLFASANAMTPLERLQRTRIEQRLTSGPAPDLRAPWSTRTIAAGIVVSLLGICVVLAWPEREPVTFDNVLAHFGVAAAAPTHTRIVDQTLRVEPPTYTRQATSTTTTLDAKAPQGTRLQWTLHFAPQPGAADLVFHDGRRLALARNGDAWSATDVLARSALYRIVLKDAPPLTESKLHRLDAIADRLPEVRVVQPDRGLTLMKTGQRSWALQFEASDDYGVSSAGRLRITIAHGSGESIVFREQEMRLGGAGAATSKRYTTQLDLRALNLEEGDDLVVQMRVD